MAETQKPEKPSPGDKTETAAEPKEESSATGTPIQLPSRQSAAQKDAAKTPNNPDAVALLSADHRRVEKLFADYEKAKGRTPKRKLADQICLELEIHTKLEEQIFYPACREADGTDDMLDEAQVEHDTAKLLVIELRQGQPSNAFYDAKVKVLAEYIKHHVGEEEGAQGIFAKAKAGGLDLQQLGDQMARLKQELSQADAQEPPEFVSLDLAAAANGNQSPKATREESTMARQDNMTRDDDRTRGRGRDEDGRFTGDRGRSSRGRDDDDDRGGSRSRSRDDDDRDNDRGGWFGDSRGHSEAARRGWEDRGSSRSSRSRDDDDDRDGGRSRSSRSRDDDDDDRGGNRSRSRDDDDRGNGRGGWFGDSRGHSEAARRGWDDRGSSRSSRSRDDDDDDDRGGSRSRSRDDDDRGSSRSRSRDDDDRGNDRGGWFGDPRGHSEAARRGWEDRGSSRSSRARDDDDDDRGGNRSRSRDDDDRANGRGGWFGDSRGHSEAARRGWEDRR